jgi:hypothetical protein
VLFFNGHYGISLLDISTLFTLVPASLGSGPCYGQNVSVLDREVDHALVVSCGSILCLEYPIFERNHYVFTSYLSHLVKAYFNVLYFHSFVSSSFSIHLYYLCRFALVGQ